VDVRVLATTRRDLRALVASGVFREDLYFRLDVLELQILPLRERRADLAPLLTHFLERFTPTGKVPPGVSPRAWAALTEYGYPGNVREFAHAIERSLALSRGDEIGLEHLPQKIAGALASDGTTPNDLRPLAVAIEEFERGYVLRALRQAGGVHARATELLGISRKALLDKVRKYDIADSEIEPRRERRS
jgi:DNA-binding NtrC family response regulator